MGVINGTSTLSGTGVKTINVGVQPKGLQIIVTSKGSETYSHQSLGFADDSGYATCHSTYQDATGGKSTQSSGNNSKVISLYERVSGTLTEVFAANFHSFTSTQVKVDVTTANSNYTLNLVIWY